MSSFNRQPRSGASQQARFWKPGTLAPGVEIQRSLTAHEEAFDGTIVYNDLSHLPLHQQRQTLPIARYRREILWALEKFRVVILVGQTGSGKTTQVPQYLHEAGWTAGNRAICCCQPRQMAAVLVSQRVAEEMGPERGKLVGHRIRFSADADAPADPKLVFMTDTALVCETMDDPLLTKYSVIMIDEVHERSVQTDLLLGLCRKILKQRKDLRIIISSATLQAEKFRSYFDGKSLSSFSTASSSAVASGVSSDSHILHVEGRQFPVDLRYAKHPTPDYIQAVVETVIHIYRNVTSRTRNPSKMPHGDILCFLTGPEDIQQVRRMLENSADDMPLLEVYPFHAKLTPYQHLQALRPVSNADRRKGVLKCIVSSNLAETSVTISGISYVIDAGFTKMVAYDPNSSIATLQTTPISQQSAVQRAGRAGRHQSGICYRLYSESDFLNLLPRQTVPEICRTQLSGVVLQLKALGVDDIVHFDFCQPPPLELLTDALELCYALGCLDTDGKLTTPMGRTVAEFMGMSGILESPHLAKLIWSSGQPEMHCSNEISTIAALLTVKSVFNTPKSFQHRADMCKRIFAVEQGDHLTLLNVFNAFVAAGQSQDWCNARYLNFKALRRAVEVRRRLRGFMKRLGIPLLTQEQPEQILRCLVSAYFMNAAQQDADGHAWTTPRGQNRLQLHPSSVLANMIPNRVTSWTSVSTSVTLKGSWVVFHELMHTSQTFMRDCAVINPHWLPELAPDYFDFRPRTRGESSSPPRDPELRDIADEPSALPEKIIFRPRKHRRLF